MPISLLRANLILSLLSRIGDGWHSDITFEPVPADYSVEGSCLDLTDRSSLTYVLAASENAHSSSR